VGSYSIGDTQPELGLQVLPTPVACASRGLAGTLLSITRVLFWLPAVSGENLTMRVQLAPDGSDPPDTGHVPPVILKAATEVR